MRGRLKSRGIESILAEAGRLGQGGVREAILMARIRRNIVLTSNCDLGIGAAPDAALGLEATSLDWLRVLYLYPSMISPVLLDVYAQQERLCTYFDYADATASDRLLRTMKRGYTQRTLSFARHYSPASA